jgi:CheY-like chemotaxis protein
VDDDAKNRELLVRLLAPVGFRVTEAVDGQAALEAIARERPDVVLMDVVMPVMDGLEATRRICANDPGLPVVAISASVLAEDSGAMLRAGASAFLHKPFRSADVLAEIARRTGAEYVYEGGPSAPASHARVALDAVPGPLHRKLYAAAEELDRDAVAACLAELDALEPALALWVKEKSSAFAWDDILDALGGPGLPVVSGRRPAASPVR